MFTCTHAFLISCVLSLFFFFETLIFSPFSKAPFPFASPIGLFRLCRLDQHGSPLLLHAAILKIVTVYFLCWWLVVLECLAWLSRVWEARHYILILWVRLASDEPLCSSHVFIAYIPSDIWFHPLFDSMALHFFPQLFKAQFCKLGGINMFTTIHNTTHTQTAKYLICYNMKNCNQIYIQH